MMTSTEKQTNEFDQTVNEYVKNWRFSLENDRYFALDWRTFKGYTKDRMKREIRLAFRKESGNNQREILDRIENVEGIRNVYGRTLIVKEGKQLFMNTYEKSPVMQMMEYGNEDIQLKQEYVDLYNELLEHLHETQAGIDVTLAHGKITIFDPDNLAGKVLIYRTKEKEVGKTLQCRIVAEIVGNRNSIFIGERDLEGNYNPYVKNRLVVINDLGKSRLSNQSGDIKSAITDRRITCREKFVGERQITNHSCWMMTTNEWCNFNIMEDERRHVMPDLREKKFPRDKGAKIDALIEAHDVEFLAVPYMMMRDTISDPYAVLNADHQFTNQEEVNIDMVPHHIQRAKELIYDRHGDFLTRPQLNAVIDALIEDKLVKTRYRGLKKEIMDNIGGRLTRNKYGVKGWRIPQEEKDNVRSIHIKNGKGEAEWELN